MKTVKRIVLFSGLVIFLSSCVSTKQFNETRDKLKRSLSENEMLKKDKMELETAKTELESKVEILTAQNKELRTRLDDTMYGMNIQKQNNSALEKEMADLQRQLEILNSGSSAEIEKLLADRDLMFRCSTPK